MSAKHTPWRLDPGSRCVIDETGATVAVVCLGRGDDGRALAAAPDLLEALAELVAFASSCHEDLVRSGVHVDEEPPQVTAARAAIQKARGGA
jgi:hypothetical protein